MSKRKHEDASIPQPGLPSSLTPTHQLYESTPIHDRSSVFKAIFQPHTDGDNSNPTPKSLQRHEPFSSAMHRMVAWRRPSTQRSLAGSFGGSGRSDVVYETGSDEDGERYAGKKLERVLEGMGVAGVVVVARWYGGVMLGPVRFKWIEDSAREAILKWKGTLEVGSGGKRVKVGGDGDGGVQDEAKEKERLVGVLRERDESVTVLRNLLAQKGEELRRAESGKDGDGDESGENKADGSVKSPVAASLDYSSMPLQRLKQLEKARDATLSWILKQIDVIEEKVSVIQRGKTEPG